MNIPLSTPVLFLIFNRLEETKQVFQSIRKTVPKKLYIACDGPRKDRIGEKEKVENVRKYVLDSIDWECEVKTLFRDINLGCGKAVSQAITWFFKNEEEGIILEDDCLPADSFFYYCEELLEKYRNKKKIFHITGYNPLTYTKLHCSYYFAIIMHCWGWASWRRAWEKYNYDIVDLDIFKKKIIKKYFKQKHAQEHWVNIFKDMQLHKIDTWDYQWVYAIMKNHALCINPAKNLISNIGFNNEATHTFDTKSIFSNQKKYEISNIIHPIRIKIYPKIINNINFVCDGIIYENISILIKKKLKKYLKKILIYLHVWEPLKKRRLFRKYGGKG